MTAEDPAKELDRLAGMLRRLRPDGRNPEPFYEARSEIAAGMQRLARTLGHSPPAPISTPATPRVIALHGYPCTCAGCGKPFRARRKEQRHCSPGCRVRAFKQRRRDAKAA
jgi:hypothetical protein